MLAGKYHFYLSDGLSYHQVSIILCFFSVSDVDIQLSNCDIYSVPDVCPCANSSYLSHEKDIQFCMFLNSQNVYSRINNDLSNAH